MILAPDSVTQHITLTHGGDATPNIELSGRPWLGSRERRTSGSPRSWSLYQDWGFSFANFPDGGLDKKPGGLGASPRHYRQNRHQGRAGAALRAVWASSRCNWSISPARVVSCASRLSIRAFSSSTSIPSSEASPGGGVFGGVGGVAGGRSARSTTQTEPWGVFRLYPLITPLVNRRLIVWVDTCKAAAASVIDTSMVFSVSSWLINRLYIGYTVFTRFDRVPA